jgi:DNA-binding response OmpR family regulator
MTTILIVDDDPQLPRLLARVLTQQGFVCTTATNAADGLAAATMTPPDVVLLDINLGRQSGLEVHKAIRTMLDPAPAVLFITSRRDLFAEMVPQLGPADDWIIKPWDPAELLARVRFAARRAAEARG